jgi:hypothetical protein
LLLNLILGSNVPPKTKDASKSECCGGSVDFSRFTAILIYRTILDFVLSFENSTTVSLHPSNFMNDISSKEQGGRCGIDCYFYDFLLYLILNLGPVEADNFCAYDM